MKPPPRHTGHALAGTMIFLMLAMLLWVGAHRQLATHLRTDKAWQVHEESTGCRRAMAWALSLLETGKPPVPVFESYLCRMVLEDDTYVATMTRTSGNEVHVEVRPRMSPADDLLPVAPESF